MTPNLYDLNSAAPYRPFRAEGRRIQTWINRIDRILVSV